MAYLLNILGATSIGGVIILMLMQVNLQISSFSTEVNQTMFTQSAAYSSAQILENDFYKIGYRISGDKVKLADSTKIKYYVDLNNDGAADSIYYYPGTTSELSTSPNPNDKPIYRVENSGSPNIASIATDFKITYYDAMNNQLSYASLTSSTERNKIMNIQIYLKFESDYMVDSVYQGIEWQKTVRPKNLGL